MNKCLWGFALEQNRISFVCVTITQLTVTKFDHPHYNLSEYDHTMLPLILPLLLLISALSSISFLPPFF